MKKLNLILVLTISIFFTSCDKDSDEASSVGVVQEDVMGTWLVTGYLVEDGKTITEAEGQSVTQNYTAYGKDYDMTLTFNNDPNTAVSNGSYTVVLKTTILGQSYEQESTATTAFASSEWKVAGSDLILITEGKETAVKVAEMTATKMVMVLDIDEELELDASTKVATSGKLTITLEK